MALWSTGLVEVSFIRNEAIDGSACALFKGQMTRSVGVSEWGFYALSASKAIFRVRTYSRITYPVWWV